MHVRRFATYVEVLTPAKLNLFLEVLARRADGYHEIETLIAGVGIYDSLTFTPAIGPNISLECCWAAGLATNSPNALRQSTPDHELLYGDLPVGPKNLAWRAVELVRNVAKIDRGAKIRLIKRIPAAAGLGGASSDAAAALVAANEAWSLNWPRQRLLDLAADLGSDVPFFLSRGVAVCRGRGEQITQISARPLQVVIVRPPIGIGTAQAYKACRPADKPAAVQGMQIAMEHGDPAKVGRLLVNRLEPAAASLTPWIQKLRETFAREDVLGHQMSGSGSSYFGFCRSARSARRVAARLRATRCGAVFAAATAAAN